MQTTLDAFLDGKVQAHQPKHGYRAATDPVFLAAACLAKPGQTVLELGCGVGVASLCLMSRVDVSVTGLELQSDYAALARQNAARNQFEMDIIEGDIAALPSELREQSFDHVIANPPYYPKGGGTSAADAGREFANREILDLDVWVDAAARRLKPKGWLTLIILAERMGELLVAMGDRFGAVEIIPLTARAGRDAGRIILRARKGAKAPLRLRVPFVIHDGATHGSDGADYSEEAENILRNGAEFSH